jgi:hypothetical protein
MTNRSKLIFIAVVAIIGFAVTVELIQRPSRLRAQFIGNLYHERYDQAAEMLLPPSAIEASPDGNLTIVSHDRDSVTIPATKLPFMSGGGSSLKSDEFSVTALGPSTDGILHTPGVVLRLTLDGYKVRIVSIES